MNTQDKSRVPAVCNNCRFWLRSEPEPGESQSDLFGECKRYPPQWVVIEGESTQVVPLTGNTDFCGEFKLRCDA